MGHAALTDRLLDADPLWTWEPLAYRDGLPAFDATGGLWIKLTVCGHTRIGYGHAAPSSYKDIGAREKEVIGDALRNAAMRFGAALDLWHKGDLHLDEEEPATPIPESSKSIGKSELDKMDAKRQAVITDLSIEVSDTFRDTGPEEAYDYYVQARDNLSLIEEQAALRSLLAAPIKTVFGKIAAARKENSTANVLPDTA